MDSLVTKQARVLPMSIEAIGKVRQLEMNFANMPQVPLKTSHVLHAGVYARTITLPEGIFITGALIKRSTSLIVMGHCLMYLGHNTVEISGCGIVAASANRKQAFHALKETHLTMMFATNATTVEEAENEFTDEGDLLMSRQPDAINNITITGE